MDCAVCGAELKTGIMNKVKGTYIKKGKKQYVVCRDCQKEGEKALKEKLGKRV
jgi:hypothetical protein